MTKFYISTLLEFTELYYLSIFIINNNMIPNVINQFGKKYLTDLIILININILM